MTDTPEQPKKPIGRPFKKGQSGNPAGRAAGSRTKAVMALDVLGEQAGREIVEAVIKAAKGGDARSAELVLKRIWPERKTRPVVVDLPEITTAANVVQALAQITAAAAAGEITPDEAQAIAALVEAQRKAIETTELEGRIAALEAQAGEQH